jgi:xylulose-5-phosphate/fructose-6-phosphate phosphoketolase
MPRSSNQSSAVLEAEDLTADGAARATVQGAPLSREELRKIDAYWRANLYLRLGMFYLKENPLPEEPLRAEYIDLQAGAAKVGRWPF